MVGVSAATALAGTPPEEGNWNQMVGVSPATALAGAPPEEGNWNHLGGLFLAPLYHLRHSGEGRNPVVDTRHSRFCGNARFYSSNKSGRDPIRDALSESS